MNKTGLWVGGGLFVVGALIIGVAVLISAEDTSADPADLRTCAVAVAAGPYQPVAGVVDTGNVRGSVELVDWYTSTQRWAQIRQLVAAAPQDDQLDDAVGNLFDWYAEDGPEVSLADWSAHLEPVHERCQTLASALYP